MDPVANQWEYLAAVPGGLENFAEEEIREKCNDVLIKWKGNGAIHFSTSLCAPVLMDSLRSVERLFGYVTHYELRPAKDRSDISQLNEIQQLAPKLFWEPALKLWHSVNSNKPNPQTAQQNLTFRVTCKRSGEHHNFCSMDAAAIFGASINDYFHWKPKMKNFDLEVFFNIRETQAWIGISLSSQKQSARNRCELGKTTLSAAIAYLMCRIARLQPGFFVVDPMAGVGTIPIEGSQQWKDCFYISADVWPENNAKAAVNIQKFATPNCVEVIHWDIMSLPLKDNSVDRVLCDMPYGTMTSQHTSTPNASRFWHSVQTTK
jgi:23S rRNA G2445 N2-methylase RlmL